MMDALGIAAKTALETSLALKSTETLLIITDDNKMKIGQALYSIGKNIAKDALLVLMPPADVNGQEPPGPIADLMKKYSVVVCPTTKSLTHTDARRNACKEGARVATMPGITEDCMIRTLKADYNIIAERTLKVSAILDKGQTVRITTPLGTDLTMPISGIKAISSTGLIRDKGQGGNLPSGESFLMPEEGKSNGVLYIDAALAGIGKITSGPVKVTIRDGYAEAIDGGPEAQELFKQLNAFGKPGMNVAELGIGTNHEALITGMILEDEKAMGTIHVAFGNNISMGGTHSVGIHIDGVVTKATVYVDNHEIMKDGRLLIG
ncbi:MAG: aminopeptidase [Calditrichaceae bacterium]